MRADPDADPSAEKSYEARLTLAKNPTPLALLVPNGHLAHPYS